MSERNPTQGRERRVGRAGIAFQNWRTREDLTGMAEMIRDREEAERPALRIRISRGTGCVKRRNSECKGPGVVAGMACSRPSKENSAAGMKRGAGGRHGNWPQKDMGSSSLFCRGQVRRVIRCSLIRLAGRKHAQRQHQPLAEGPGFWVHLGAVVGRTHW